MSDPLVASGGVICVVLIGLVVLAVVWGRRVRRQRWERTQLWAQQHGWRVTTRPEAEWWCRLPGANPRGITLVLSGAVGDRPVHVAEYAVTDTTSDGAGGTTTSTRHYTVVVAALRNVLPDITVESRHALSRLKNKVAGPGNAGTGDPHFDREFRIRTSAPHAVTRWCTPQVIAAHASGHVLVPWSVQGRELLHYTSGRVELPTVIPYAASLAWLGDVLDSGARQ